MSKGLDHLPLSGPWGSLRAVPAVPRWSLRGQLSDLAPIAQAWATPLPTHMLTSVEHADRAALRLGPDEWLLIGGDAATGPALMAVAANAPCALVDVADRNIGLALEGAAAATVLNAGVPLDLAPAAFPNGMATRTLFGKAEIVLWRRAQAWRIEVWRSFADYVVGGLIQAAADL